MAYNFILFSLCESIIVLYMGYGQMSHIIIMMSNSNILALLNLVSRIIDDTLEFILKIELQL